MFTSPKEYLNLLNGMGISEFKLRDQGTFLGFLWTLLYPLSMFLVLYAIFSKWMGTHVQGFPGYLLVGIVLWNFFVNSVANSLSIISRKSDLVRNLNFPKEILVISSVCSIFISFIIEIIILLLFLLFLGTRYSLYIFYFPVVLLIEIILSLGVSFVLACLHVYYRDVERIWAIVSMLGFFLTPIFYPLSIIARDKQKIMLFNPMLHVIESARNCLLYQKAPHLGNILLVLAISIVIFFTGYYFFKKKESEFAEIV